MATNNTQRIDALTQQVSMLTTLMTQFMATQVAQPVAPATPVYTTRTSVAPRSTVEREALPLDANCLGIRKYGRKIIAVLPLDDFPGETQYKRLQLREAAAFDLKRTHQAQTGNTTAVAMPVWYTPGQPYPAHLGAAPEVACDLLAIY